jgi:hypothetical protein
MRPLPAFFKEKLKHICAHCHCNQETMWRNYHREEQHFDTTFSYVDSPGKSNGRCFLNRKWLELWHRTQDLHKLVYTMRVPFFSDQILTFSMVHHIRVEGRKFVPTNNATGNNVEHMFAFISGLESELIRKLLTDYIPRWQDISYDHLKTSAGVTPLLFVAGLLLQYGSVTSEKIRHAYKNLKKCDSLLIQEIDYLGKSNLQSSLVTKSPIRNLNHTLIDLNMQLTEIRSTRHYLENSAYILVNHAAPFDNYVKSRLHEWDENPDSRELFEAVQNLESCMERVRDNNKLVMVRQTMSQYQTDIESLQRHIDINVSMVSHSMPCLCLLEQVPDSMQVGNLIAERDRLIQQSIADNTAKDGAKMKVIAIFTALFLPATFMAVYFKSSLHRSMPLISS